MKKVKDLYKKEPTWQEFAKLLNLVLLAYQKELITKEEMNLYVSDIANLIKKFEK